MRIAGFVLLVFAASAAPAAIVEGVVVETPEVRVVSSIDTLRAWCRADGVYDACTFFVGFRLEATCVPNAGEWQFRPTASFRPWIVLKNVGSLSHEHRHIAEITRAAGTHVVQMRRLQFPSKERCEQRAFMEGKAFPSRMAAFARLSNASMHPLAHVLAAGRR